MNLEYLLRWWESSQFVGGHSQIGARRLLHLLVVHHKELLLEIAGEEQRTTTSDLSGIFGFLLAMPLVIGVPGFALTALDTCFSIDGDAIVAKHKELSPKT